MHLRRRRPRQILRYVAAEMVQPLEKRSMLHADLTVAFKSSALPESLIVGDTAKGGASVVVSNVVDDNDVIAKNTKVTLTFALRPIGTAGASDVVIGTAANQNVGGIGNGKTKQVNAKLAVPGTLAAGTYALVVTVDSGNAVEEANEANNTTALASPQVTVGPSTANVGVTAATTTLAGKQKSKTGTVTLKNLGNVDVKGPVDIAFVASAAGVEDQVLGTASNVQINLKTNQSKGAKPVKLNAPTGAAGTVFNISARINPKFSPADTVSADNTAAAGTYTVPASNNGGGGGGGTDAGANPFADIGLGQTWSFTKTQSLPGDGLFGNIAESGTITDGAGHTGTYSLAMSPPIAAQQANVLDIDFANAGAFPGLERRFVLTFTNKNARPANGFNGKSIVVQTGQAGAIATLEIQGTPTLYYMRFA